MATADERPEPPVLERGGFRLGQDRRLTANGFERVDGPRLAELFHPELSRSRRDRERIMQEACLLFTKPWFAAQPAHYGVKFPASAAKGRLGEILEGAVDSGKCVSVPEAVARMQQSMRSDYEVMSRRWEEDDACAWDKAKKRRADEAFAKCTTPAEKASCDLDRFMDRYFLTEGKPAKDGTRQAFDLERCQGSYVLRCEAAEDHQEHEPEALFTLDICAGKDGLLVAAHDFGLFEGTMILSRSEEKLRLLDELEGKEDTDDGSYDYGYYDEDEEDRRNKGPSLAEVVASRKRKAESGGGTAGGGPAQQQQQQQQQKTRKTKRRKLTPSFSRRVYFRMRWRETGEGKIHDAPEAGHLDFLGDRGTEFAGLAYEFPYMGRNVEFRGFKVSDAPRRRPEPWSAFSSAAYEHARSARW
ncbi:hypothetical protein LX36DRAFT_637800 [Colletotrichum falcatum]|nr:hypothetical protein LX36DRAFT_637800 [Colletotrichum falcatum]